MTKRDELLDGAWYLINNYSHFTIACYDKKEHWFNDYLHINEIEDDVSWTCINSVDMLVKIEDIFGKQCPTFTTNKEKKGVKSGS